MSENKILTFRIPTTFKKTGVMEKFLAQFTRFVVGINKLVKSHADDAIVKREHVISNVYLFLGINGFTFKKLVENEWEDIKIDDAMRYLFKLDTALDPSALARLVFRKMWVATRLYASEQTDMLNILEKIPVM